MTHQEPFVRERTDMLDSLGNTTAATGKGFAIGSAALTALALLAAYIITVQTSLTQQAEQVGKDLSPGQVVYQAGSPFLVRVPDSPDVDAGLLLAPRNRHKIRLALAATSGQITAQYDATREAFNASVTDGANRYEFEIVPASRATLPQIMSYYNVTLMNPRVLCGLFIGVMLVFVFCAMTMNAVGRAAFAMMQECRRQFVIMKKAFKKNGLSDADIADPLKWPFQVDVDGKSYPDYANCVAISTVSAQKEMFMPSVMAIVAPIVVGLILGVPGVMGMLVGALVCGFAVAIFMANAGGAWDNAKKYIESGQLGGKGSDNHKATVVGDTVGDPFKDTSGPSLNILIKLISVVSVVFAGLVVKFSPIVAGFLHLD